MTKFSNEKKKFKRTLDRIRGFTLVETLIAVSIFSVSILGLFSILSQGVASTNYAKQKVIASYLAQEGVEYMRNMRDTFVLYSATPSDGWTAFSSKLFNASCASGCYFNDQNLNFFDQSQPMIDLSIIPCFGPGGSCPTMLYDGATGKYGYATGVNSGFSRKISVNFYADEIKISSIVSWTQGSGSQTTTFSESLFNWIE